MAIKIGSNFAYNGKLPNFERDSFKDKAAMKAFNENSIDEGHLSYCKEDGNIYQYKSTNAADATTGRWRIFKPDIVVDAALNGTSKNPIQNKAVFEALKAKADSAALGAYQPKYKADYVATRDFNYSELPTNAHVVDLNGYTMIINDSGVGTFATSCMNGNIQIKVNGIEIDEVNIINTTISADNNIKFNIAEPIFHNCKISKAIINDSAAEFYDCDLIFCTFGTAPVMHNCRIDSSEITVNTADGGYMCNVIIEYKAYKHAIIKNNKFVEAGFEADIDNPTIQGNAPSCEAIVTKFNGLATKTELNGKADKTQLNDLATKTELNSKADVSALNNYVTTATANSTYAKKSDISNVYKFKGTKTNYADLPTTNRVTGDVWNITNADATHGIKAGDNVAWNGTAWDNLSGTVDLSAYAKTANVNAELDKKADVTTTDAMSADIKKLMDKAFPFTVKVSIDKTLAKKGTSQPVKVTITPKIGDDNTEVDTIMINGEEHHGTIPYVYSTTATTTTTYNVRADKTGRNSAKGSATITFVNPSYDGAVAANFTVTEANIKALTETLRSGKGGTRTFNLNNQKACIAYPKAFDVATGIKDANGFDYLASYTRSELNVNGELYYVYLLTNATTITDMKQTVS